MFLVGKVFGCEDDFFDEYVQITIYVAFWSQPSALIVFTGFLLGMRFIMNPHFRR